MSDPELYGLSDFPSYVINIKWGLEGLVMPAVGVLGVLGKSCAQQNNCSERVLIRCFDTITLTETYIMISTVFSKGQNSL